MCDLVKLLVVPAISFCVGLVMPFALRRLTRFFLGPKLEVEFDRDEIDAKLGNTSRPQCYFRVKVRNAKPNVLRGCRGYLTRIVDVNTSKPVLDETFPLIWSYDPSRESFDLPRGPTPTIDVALYEQGSQFFIPCLRSAEGATLVPFKFEKVLFAKGIYEFTVLVSGEDVDPKIRKFRVTYDGQNWPPKGEAL